MNKLKILSISICFLVVSIFSETQGAEHPDANDYYAPQDLNIAAKQLKIDSREGKDPHESLKDIQNNQRKRQETRNQTDHPHKTSLEQQKYQYHDSDPIQQTHTKNNTSNSDWPCSIF